MEVLSGNLKTKKLL